MKTLNPGVDCSWYVDDFLICYRSKHMHTIERQLQQNLNQSRTNGPINAHLTIAPGITTTMKNKKHCCKSFVKISALAQQ